MSSDKIHKLLDSVGAIKDDPVVVGDYNLDGSKDILIGIKEHKGGKFNLQKFPYSQEKIEELNNLYPNIFWYIGIAPRIEIKKVDE